MNNLKSPEFLISSVNAIGLISYIIFAQQKMNKLEDRVTESDKNYQIINNRHLQNIEEIKTATQGHKKINIAIKDNKRNATEQYEELLDRTSEQENMLMSVIEQLKEIKIDGHQIKLNVDNFNEKSSYPQNRFENRNQRDKRNDNSRSYNRNDNRSENRSENRNNRRQNDDNPSDNRSENRPRNRQDNNRNNRKREEVSDDDDDEDVTRVVSKLGQGQAL